MTDELNNVQAIEEENSNNAYIDALNELKATTVSKDKFNKLEAENKRLLQSLVNGETIDGVATSGTQEKSLSELRAEFLKTEDIKNLSWITTALELRDRLIAEGHEDPAVPQGIKVQATQADRDMANRVCEGLRELVQDADGNADYFRSEYLRRVR